MLVCVSDCVRDSRILFFDDHVEFFLSVMTGNIDGDVGTNACVQSEYTTNSPGKSIRSTRHSHKYTSYIIVSGRIDK
jgi:hypothetical protein